jgi:hypothetical protein
VADGVALGVAPAGVPPSPPSPVSPPESVGVAVGLSEPLSVGVGEPLSVGVGEPVSVGVEVGVGDDVVGVGVGDGDVALTDGVGETLGDGVALAAGELAAVHDGEGVADAVAVGLKSDGVSGAGDVTVPSVPVVVL